MAWSRKGWAVYALALSLCAGKGRAETLPTTPEDALHAMTELAGVIFSGQVSAVRRVAPKGSLAGNPTSAGVVEIEFAVEDAVRGVNGSSYTVREWAGLWPAGDEPFRVGQRYLMLLHAPGPGGLSSPVGGMDGAIPIRGAGAAVRPDTAEPVSGATSGMSQSAGTAEQAVSGHIGVTAKHVSAGGALAIGTEPEVSAVSSTAADGQVVDLGWVGTRAVRPVTYAQPATRAGVRALTAGGVSANGGSASTAVSQASGVIAGADYGTVLVMLRNWNGGDHGTR